MDFGFQKKCLIPSHSDSESITSLLDMFNVMFSLSELKCGFEILMMSFLVLLIYVIIF